MYFSLVSVIFKMILYFHDDLAVLGDVYQLPPQRLSKGRNACGTSAFKIPWFVNVKLRKSFFNYTWTF